MKVNFTQKQVGLIKVMKVRSNRQYFRSYLNFGFSWTEIENKRFPLCVVGGEKMSNEAVVPRKRVNYFARV